MSQAVSEIMSDVRDTVAAKDTPLAQVWSLMRERHIEHVPVLDGDVLVGIVSSYDIARAAMEREGGVASATADDVMEKALERVHPKSSVDDALAILSAGRFHSVPVVDDEEQLVGIVTTSDLLRHLAG